MNPVKIIKEKYNNKEKRKTRSDFEKNKDIEETTVPKNFEKNGMILKPDSMEFHECTLFGVGNEGDEIPQCDIPYIPSLKSLPGSSSSETTSLIQLNNKELDKSSQPMKKNKSLTHNEEIITLSIEDETLQNALHYKNATNISTETDKCNNASDFDINYLSDHESVRTSIKQLYFLNKTEIAKASQETTEVYDDPLSDKSVQCNNQTNNHNSKYRNQNTNSTIPTLCGTGEQETIEIPKQCSNEYFINCNTRVKKSLHLFDCNKYPLTDSLGRILKTAGGKHLVKYKNGIPYDIFGRPVYDLTGNSSLNPDFNPFSKLLRNTNIISAIQLFDFRGYCLLDYDGASLKNAEGKDLVQVDKTGKILYDINKHPIFDKNGIPVTKQKGLWLLPTGTPVRIFDKTKHPLTNRQGKPLHDIKKKELLKTDEHGRPLIDCNNNPVFDALGNPATQLNFNPSVKPPDSSFMLIALLINKPAKLFDKRGWPLTEKNGEVMNDANGCCLLTLKKMHPNEISDFDQLFFQLEKPIPLTEICLNLPGTKLESEKEYTNTNQDDIKEKREIILDFVGHPLNDRFTANVFDKNGRKIFLNIKFYFIGTSASTICISDQNANFSEINQNSEQIISFQAETDLLGRPLNDCLNRPLFDKYGRPFFDLFGRAIYDSKGQPIATAEAKRLDNGLDESPGINIGFKVSCLTPQDPNNLPKITDLNGGPIFDSLGYPLYNKKGKPLMDAYGRPLYDENGFPLCDNEGRPTSKLVKHRHLPLLSVEDKFEYLQLSPAGAQIKTPDWEDELTSENTEKGQNDDLPTNKVTMSFIARIRVTTFSNGEKYYEVLESVPLP